jgi:SP family myo-inositol transporter-like MFS transporter 13
LKSSFKELFSKPSNLRSLTIACALQAAQQFVGFNALMYFSSSIFEMVGFKNSTLVSCFIAGTNFITTILAILIIDKVGRRNILLISVPLLLISQIICAVSFSHMDISMQTLHNDGNNDWKYPLLTGLILFVAFYSIGLGNVPWQQSELFPQKVRGLGSSFSTATNWFGSMLVSFCFLTLMDTISPSMTFLLFAGNTFLAFLFIYFLYPELTGLQLEEVQNLLSDGFNVEKSVEMYQDYKNYHPLQ